MVHYKNTTNTHLTKPCIKNFRKKKDNIQNNRLSHSFDQINLFFVFKGAEMKTNHFLNYYNKACMQ